MVHVFFIQKKNLYNRLLWLGLLKIMLCEKLIDTLGWSALKITGCSEKTGLVVIYNMCPC